MAIAYQTLIEELAQAQKQIAYVMQKLSEDQSEVPSAPVMPSTTVDVNTGKPVIEVSTAVPSLAPDQVAMRQANEAESDTGTTKASPEAVKAAKSSKFQQT